jgi:hypothetical protein
VLINLFTKNELCTSSTTDFTSWQASNTSGTFKMGRQHGNIKDYIKHLLSWWTSCRKWCLALEKQANLKACFNIGNLEIAIGKLCCKKYNAKVKLAKPGNMKVHVCAAKTFDKEDYKKKVATYIVTNQVCM